MIAVNRNSTANTVTRTTPNVRITTHNGVTEVVPASAVLQVHDRTQGRLREVSAADIATTYRLRAPRRGGAFKAGDVRYGFASRNSPEGAELDLPLFAGLVGVWLADGTANSPAINTCNRDVEEVHRWLGFHGVEVGPIKPTPGQDSSSFSLPGIRGILRDMGLLDRHPNDPNRRCKNPHIPAAYMNAPRCDRADLLRGLMAGDGSVTKSGVCVYSTVSERLAQDVHQLAVGLGLRATLNPRTREYARKNGTTPVEHKVTFTPPISIHFVPVTSFQMGRLAKHWRRVAESPARTHVEHITGAHPTYEPVTANRSGLPIVGWAEAVDADVLETARDEAQSRKAMIGAQHWALFGAIVDGPKDDTGVGEVIPLFPGTPDAA